MVVNEAEWEIWLKSSSVHLNDQWPKSISVQLNDFVLQAGYFFIVHILAIFHSFFRNKHWLDIRSFPERRL